MLLAIPVVVDGWVDFYYGIARYMFTLTKERDKKRKVVVLPTPQQG